MNERATLPPAELGGLLLASPLLHVPPEGRAIVLLAAQPDAARPGRCRLEATVVPEGPLPAGLRLVVQWQGGQRSVRLDGAGRARLSGVPLAALQALQAGEAEALRVRIEADL